MEKTNTFEDARLDAMMERYRSEIVRLQRATPPPPQREQRPADYEKMQEQELFAQPAIFAQSSTTPVLVKPSQNALASMPQSAPLQPSSVQPSPAQQPTPQTIAPMQQDPRVATRAYPPTALPSPAGREQPWALEELQTPPPDEAAQRYPAPMMMQSMAGSAQAAPPIQTESEPPQALPPAPRLVAALDQSDVQSVQPMALPEQVADPSMPQMNDYMQSAFPPMQSMAPFVFGVSSPMVEPPQCAYPQRQSLTASMQSLSPPVQPRVDRVPYGGFTELDAPVTPEPIAAVTNGGTSTTTASAVAPTERQPAVGQLQKGVLGALSALSQMAATQTPPRLAFGKGAGALGQFKPYERFGLLCKAGFLADPTMQTPAFVRFSSDVGAAGADAVRCRRGLAMELQTEKGACQLLFSHLPCDFLRDAALLPQLLGAMQPNSRTGLREQNRLWQFICKNPQALHATLWLCSDLGTAGSYRTLDYYGIPLVVVGEKGERRAVRFRLSPKAKTHPLSRFEAEELAGCDPDALSRDLFMTLHAGEQVQFELGAQFINDRERENLEFDPFDPTLVWSSSRFPVVPLGLLLLTQNPEAFKTEVEERTFSPACLVEGLELPDTSLYSTLCHALANVQQLRVPRAAQRMPKLSSVDGWLRTYPAAKDLQRAGERLLGMNERERRRLMDNLSEELSRLDAEVLEEVLLLLSEAELSFGRALALSLKG